MSSFGDGWDDELDLSDGGLDTTGEEEQDGKEEGWGDDDDLNFDDDDDDDDEEDDNNNNDDDDNNNGNDNVKNYISNVGNVTSYSSKPVVQSNQSEIQSIGENLNLSVAAQGDGWEDDDDLGINDNVSNDDFVPATPENENNGDGWGDDDDDDDDLFLDSPANIARTINHPPSATSNTTAKNPKLDGILQNLEGYVKSLSHMTTSVNAVLEFEYNTPEKAHELVEYYANRNQLAEYTRTKELSRMDYQVVLPYGHVEKDKQQIALHFLPDNSLAARSANQSLLADLLQVITGSDLIVRPQYMAVCIANQCQFTIHIGDGERGDMVECRSQLTLSLPTINGDRLPIADLKAFIVFSPSQPMVEFRLVSINVTLNDFSKLEGTAEFLVMMDIDDFSDQNEIIHHHHHDTPADLFRDQFLENSQKLLSQSTMGMKSALQQMESVVNIQQKINIVKGGYKTISSFIPDADQMLAAEQEAAELAAAREQQRQQQHQKQQYPHSTLYQQKHLQSAAPTATSRATPMGLGQSQPPPQPPLQQQALPPSFQDGPESNKQRPKSILGGLVRSGWSRLAKSVALPDDDPSIYGAPPVDKTQAPPSHGLELYRRSPDSKSKQVSPPQLRPPAAPNTAPPIFQTASSGSSNMSSTQKSTPPSAIASGQSTGSHGGSTDGSHGGGGGKRNNVFGINQKLQHQQPLPPAKVTIVDSKSTPPTVNDTPSFDSISHSVSQDSVSSSTKSNSIPTSTFTTATLPMERATPTTPATTTTTTTKPLVTAPFNKYANGNDDDNINISNDLSNNSNNGWDLENEDDIYMDSPEKASTASTNNNNTKNNNDNPVPHDLPSSMPSISKVQTPPPPKQIIVDVPYDPQEDIIETRRRWVNPRPSRPYLRA